MCVLTASIWNLFYLRRQKRNKEPLDTVAILQSFCLFYCLFFIWNSIDLQCLVRKYTANIIDLQCINLYCLAKWQLLKYIYIYIYIYYSSYYFIAIMFYFHLICFNWPKVINFFPFGYSKNLQMNKNYIHNNRLLKITRELLCVS